MALQITECRGVFSVHGNLNSANVLILERHMSRFINSKNQVILNLGRVAQLDETAAHILKKMHKNALKTRAFLSIIGLENKNVVSVMNKTQTTYILSHDRA
ncbi:STAS domain-containing protein [Flagellimonas marina]|uniref:STAS domain-containing protein n=1 Tax=Flagellimonas marina TaxID=1775168 RepID=A0ABV8PNP4_9FLAO